MLRPRFRRRLQTVAALAPAVVGAIAASVVGLVAVRHLVPVELLRASNDVVGNYLQTVGTIYAVLLAFVVYVVWTQFNEARVEVEREANEILDLYRTVGALPDSVRATVVDRLRRYTNAVCDDEWGAMAAGDEACLARTGALLDDVWATLKEFEPGSGCHSALFEEALSRFNDLSDCRTARLTSARTRIPFAMKLLLYFGAVIVVASMWLFAVDSVRIHAIITGAMAGAVSHVLYLIADLDDCFDGDWQVSSEPFERVRSLMVGPVEVEVRSAAQ